MRVLIDAQSRLGDIVRAFPFALHLSKKAARSVFIACHPKHRSILEMIDYAKWHDPDTAGAFDERYEAAIWPKNAFDYRMETPARKWFDYVAAKNEAFRKAKREIIFTDLPPLDPILEKYGLPRDYSLGCPCGYQDTILGDRPRSATEISFDLIDSWICHQVKPRGNFFYLTPPGFRPNRRHICVDDLSELATLVRHALDFATILSAPAVIASARFEGKPLRESWHYVSPINPREKEQDDIGTKEQVRWEVRFAQSGPQITREP